MYYLTNITYLTISYLFLFIALHFLLIFFLGPYGYILPIKNKSIQLTHTSESNYTRP